MSFLRAEGDAVWVEVLAKPRAAKSAVLGEREGRLEVQLAAPPVDGEANEALVRVVAEALGVARSHVAVARGASSRRKALRVTGVSLDQARLALTPAVAVARVRRPTPEVRTLVTELEALLAAEYPPEQRHGLSVDALFEPHVHFFVARRGREPVGCGGVALFEGFAEVKRMYVREAARGSGVAPAVLAQLESTARAEGRTLLRLETGDQQLAAIRFYEKSGFARCAAFGDYSVMKPSAISTSVFFEKRL